jgi:anti-sigma factor RsiW
MTNRHLTEEDLILHRYGEAPEPEAIESHLASCADCRGQRDRLEADLALLDRLVVPERDAAYGAAVWRRLKPRLAEPPRPVFAWWRPLAFATIAAALLAAAFLAGRFWRLTPEEGRALAPEVRERILLGAVGDHLDRSQVALLEYVHAPATAPEDPRETRVAEELVAANRLYRQSAASAGEAGVASVLDELERVLLELAHDPGPEGRAKLQRRIEETLFKIRVIRSQVRQREQAPAPKAARS